MKKILLSATLLLTGVIVFGQQLNNNYLKSYYPSMSYGGTPYITTLKNGNLLILQDTAITEINVNTGDSISNQSIGKFGISHPKSIVTNGDYLYVGGDSRYGFPSITKVDMNLDTIWKKPVNGDKKGSASAILADNSELYVCGTSGYNSVFIAKLDNDGDTLWTTQIPQTTFCNLSTIIKLSDGNFFAAGNLDDYPLGVKFDDKGTVLWTFTENAFISFSKAAAFEKSASEIVLVARNQMFTLDASTGVKNSSLTTGFVDFNDAITTGIDTVYLFGTHKDKQWGGNSYPLLEVRYLSLDSVKSYIFKDNVDPSKSNSFSRAISLGGSEFAVTGRLKDSTYVDASKSSFIAAKFNGKNGAVSTLKPLTNNNAVYPNPNSGILNFDNNASNIIVSTLTGQQLTNIAGPTQSIDISQLKAGSYIVSFKDSKGELNQVIVVKQ